jgi:hypothetical protein
VAIKKLLAVAVLTAVTITPAQAAQSKYWKPFDKKGLVHTICDRGNLVYIYKQGYSGGIFVLKGGCW